MSPRFEWDDDKNAINQEQHGISFEEASAVFDGDYFEEYDDAHSDDEDRFFAIGPIDRGVVMWTERLDDIIRIISARFATKREVEMYRSRV